MFTRSCGVELIATGHSLFTLAVVIQLYRTLWFIPFLKKGNKICTDLLWQMPHHGEGEVKKMPREEGQWARSKLIEP